VSGPGAGFFGKVRHHGDFVTRRLPLPMRLVLDDWLQHVLVRSRLDLGADWLPLWLNSPLWRFAIGSDVCGPQAWTGVMMPSLDRVDRCFPLVIAFELAAVPALPACLGTGSAWFAALEDLALSTLEPDFAIEAFDAALLALQGPPHACTVRQAACHAMPVDGPCVTSLAGGGVSALAHRPLGSGSAWWTEGSPRVTPSLALCNGLPQPQTFTALLDGRWAERGWRCL
jgi:type VI secretion system protein ImpM